MKMAKHLLSAIVALAVSSAAMAQDEAAERRAAMDAERDAQRAEERVEREQVRIEMREAEERLAEAARQIAELSTRNLPHLDKSVRAFVAADDRPRIGITIRSGGDEPVEGVEVEGVTPGSAAEDAGLRAGDVLTRINDEDLGASSATNANDKLLDFMSGVESGDKLKVEYLRDGNVGTVELEPRAIERRAFAWSSPDGAEFEFFSDPDVRVAPRIVKNFSFGFPWSTWGDMELVELNAGLGRYFGTDKGLLVISAPKADGLGLEDGDVIQSIDGREPSSVGHAMRILGSYEPGEAVELVVMRDKRRRTLKVEMPDERSSGLLPPAPPMPAEPPPVVREKVVVIPGKAPVVIKPDTTT